MSSLKKETDRQLRKRNKYLFDSKVENFWRFVKNNKNWYFIAIVVFLSFFCLQFINISFLNFLFIDDNNVKTLIDNRTTNIVTLISVTFAIIGFLIANLAIKESYTYNILFKKSSFFPVVFFALTLIVAFIALSTLKDSIPVEYQSRTLIVGTCLIFLAIFCIGHLFVQLVKFTNHKYILELVRKELLRESKENLRIIGRKYLSAIRINKLGFSQQSWSLYTPKIKGDFHIRKDHNVIADIRIKKLENLSNSIEQKEDISINEIKLHRELNPESNDGFFYITEENLQKYHKQMKELNNCIITSISKNKVNNESRDYVIHKLNESIKTNNNKDVREYFDILFEMYKLQQDLKV